jgi:DNA-binding transcriptional LysR family regulator
MIVGGAWREDMTVTGLSVHMLIRRVDLLTFRLFLSAIDERQIGRAAAIENIAPSAATKRIHDLEDLVGLKLLERNPKGVQPSKAGQVLARQLKSIFANLEDLRCELSEFTEGVRGHVRVAATGAIIIQHLAREIGEFTRNFPFIDVEVYDDVNPSVYRSVKNDDVDFAVYISAPDLKDDSIQEIDYRNDELVAVYPKDHPFSQKASVTLEDLLEEKLIGIRPTTTLMMQISQAARNLGRKFEPRYSVAGVEAARSMVEAGLGVTIQPECMLPHEYLDRVGCVSIAEPWARRQFKLGIRRDRGLSAASRLLIKQLSGTDPA